MVVDKIGPKGRHAINLSEMETILPKFIATCYDGTDHPHHTTPG